MGAAVIYVKDLVTMVGFYGRSFGMVEVESDPGFVVLAGAGWELSLVAVPPKVADDVVITTPPERRAATPIKLAFTVVDIESLRLVIAQSGGVPEPADAAWEFRGHRHLDCLDPEGNVVQLRQPV